MKRISTILFLGVVTAWFAVPQAAQTQVTDLRSPVDFGALMQRKLHSSQSLIKGLALEDYELIAREAQQLQLLSLDAGWNVLQTEDYARISGEFRQAAKKIGRAGKEKNLDAAGLGYFQLTMSCIDCHRHVRKNDVKKE